MIYLSYYLFSFYFLILLYHPFLPLKTTPLPPQNLHFSLPIQILQNPYFEYFKNLYDKVYNSNEKYKYKHWELHRFIMNAQKGQCVDHVDHNTFDNRKSKLLISNDNLNLQNRKGANKNSGTGVRNVHLITKYGVKQEYWVQIMKNGEKFKWEFGLNEFDEACEFARQKRIELFGKE